MLLMAAFLAQPNSQVIHSDRKCLCNRIQLDVESADLLWSLFYSALRSYRRDSVLRPFPSMFFQHDQEGEKDFDLLKETADCVPNLQTLLDGGLEECTVNEKSLDLLAWVLSTMNWDFRTVDNSEFLKIRELTGYGLPTHTPSYAFEVIHSQASNERFMALQGSRKLLYGYHGSRLENFYSILHNGLHYHLNKNSLFGKGIYLSSELSLSLLYSPTSTGWEHSILGHNLSCVAVCEFIDHPDVKCQIQGGENGTSPSRARAPETQAGDVPEKYYVVLNNSLIRIKYLLVYSNKEPKVNTRRTATTSVSWFSKHKFILIMAAYIIVLLAVGVSNSRKFNHYWKRLFS